MTNTLPCRSYRESLRDIEACLAAVPDRLYHLGFRNSVSRSTLADANERRDWRIYADFAQRLVVEARRLYVDEPLGLEERDQREQTIYALDATTIDLCLSVFPWARFRKTKAGESKRWFDCTIVPARNGGWVECTSGVDCRPR